MFELRQPAVAGRFYPADRQRLDAELARCLPVLRDEPVRALAVVAPHAGYMYSGAIAGATYARVAVPQSAVVLCPNHTGLGTRQAIWPSGAWALPGGALEVDSALAEHLMDRAGLEPDALAHLHEHAVEVHLPFLRARRADVRVVPVCLAGLSLRQCHAVGEGIARAVGEGGNVLLVASTDMSHYVSAESARQLDSMALERVVALDPDGLYRVVQGHGISMCGYVPTTVALIAAKCLGATQAELVRYGNSGETSGDMERVVGYAGLIVR